MFENMETLRMAKDMAVHAAGRQSVIAANVANADTPGYRAGDLRSFAETYRRQHEPLELRVTRAAHAVASGDTPAKEVVIDRAAEPSPNGNTVSLETELVRSASAKRQHDVSLAIYRSSLDILRSSLGRGR
jgi:flagellar basal-body rod protein FlgB